MIVLELLLMAQENQKISSLIFSDGMNKDLDDEISFVIYCSFIKHLQKNNSLQNWSEILNFKDLEIFYPKPKILEIIKKLKEIPLKELEDYVTENVYKKLGKCPNEITSVELFNLLPQKLRKKYAMYYTEKDIAYFLARLISPKDTETILDPACGDGRLLLSLQEINPHLKLHGFDTSALSNFMDKPFKHHGQIDFLSIDENFKEFVNQKYDLIIMNPPFTRQSHLSVDYRNFLSSKFQNDDDKMGQIGLHGYFILQADRFLKKNGMLALVLPASVLYSKSSKKIRNLLLENYWIKFCISYANDKSFSESSAVKEVILIAIKGNHNKSTFISLRSTMTKKNIESILKAIKSNKNNDIVQINTVDLKKIKQSDNWLEFFINKQSDSNNSNLYFRNPKITKIKQIFSMRRGTESFGPDFFFLPNKFWIIKSDNKSGLVINNIKSKEEIIFPHKYLIHSLTNPRKYSTKISPKIKEYLVTLPPINKEDFHEYVQKYIEYGSQMNLAISKSKFSQIKPWYSFVYEQLKNDSFFGNLFILRKLRLNTMGIVAHYLPEKYPASKGFYICNCDKKHVKVLCAWLNSSYFISYLIQNRRNISNNWGEVMISDLLEYPCIDPEKLSDSETEILVQTFDEFSHMELSNVLASDSAKMRSNLDDVIAKIISDKTLRRKNIEFLENLNAQIPAI